MFLPFFENLRKSGVPVSLREYLTFLEGMKAGLVTYDVEAFYYLARTAMVKDERNLDKFDRAFSMTFEGLESISAEQMLEAVDIPQEWLDKMGLMASDGAFSPARQPPAALSKRMSLLEAQ